MKRLIFLMLLIGLMASCSKEPKLVEKEYIIELPGFMDMVLNKLVAGQPNLGRDESTFEFNWNIAEYYEVLKNPVSFEMCATSNGYVLDASPFKIGGERGWLVNQSTNNYNEPDSWYIGFAYEYDAPSKSITVFRGRVMNKSIVRWAVKDFYIKVTYQVYE